MDDKIGLDIAIRVELHAIDADDAMTRFADREHQMAGLVCQILKWARSMSTTSIFFAVFHAPRVKSGTSIA